MGKSINSIMSERKSKTRSSIFLIQRIQQGHKVRLYSYRIPSEQQDQCSYRTTLGVRHVWIKSRIAYTCRSLGITRLRADIGKTLPYLQAFTITFEKKQLSVNISDNETSIKLQLSCNQHHKTEDEGKKSTRRFPRGKYRTYPSLGEEKKKKKQLQ